VIELSKKDRIEWKRFLESPSGQAGRFWLLERASALSFTKTEHSNVTAMEAGIADGYRRLLQDLDTLPILREEPKNDIISD
jgi:type II restriction/modification system DNA methylase subunit YeeA